MHRTQRRAPDRLLPVDAATRTLALELYESVADLPIVSPHGHVPVGMLLDDTPFADAAALLMHGDHYIGRLLHASGAGMSATIAGAADPREQWRTLAQHWDRLEGTAVRYWLEDEFVEVLDVETELSASTADRLYDEIGDRLRRPEFRPRALFERFGVEFLATTDDPLDDLDAHRRLVGELSGRVVPTFRPDAYVDPRGGDWSERIDRLVAATGESLSFAGVLRAFQRRREHFIAHGAVSADHGVLEPYSLEMEPGEAQLLFQRAYDGVADSAEKRALAANLLWQFARMSVEDGLVMTLHAGVLRSHHTPTLDRHGPDTGHDIPVPTSFVTGMRPILESFGTAPGFHLVLFTVDETTYSREIAPLAAFYPSVYIGAPWWFLDAPDAMARFRSAVTETAGFSRGSGFIDDTRAFPSIPSRHDTARRVDSGFLARLVVERRLSLDAAHRVAIDLVSDLPRRVFKL